MATIFSARGYRFYFYAADLNEPIHVHVAKSGHEAKIWIRPFQVASSGGFKNHELNEIERIIVQRTNEILAAWKRENVKREDS